MAQRHQQAPLPEPCSNLNRQEGGSSDMTGEHQASVEERSQQAKAGPDGRVQQPARRSSAAVCAQQQL